MALQNIRLKALSWCRQRHTVIHRSSRYFNVLGIETSCDDTGCAIVNDTGTILGEALNSQELLHLSYGGIIPPIARDLHKQNIASIVETAVNQSKISWKDIDAIAVTVKPGLPMSLIVGMEYAKDLSAIYRKPLIPIHHMEAHALTIRMIHDVKFPYLVLLVSGGNCLLALARDFDDFLLLGEGTDDAPGEALDKVARRLKLRNMKAYDKLCGGRAIEKASLKGNPLAFALGGGLLQYRDCNFSFSGLKAAARREILAIEEELGIEGDAVIPQVYDLCASFQWAVTKHLLQRLQRATEYVTLRKLMPDEKTLVVSGGVACNSFIKAALEDLCHKLNYKLLVPPPKLCQDNGAMIAWNGVEKWRSQRDFVQPDHVDTVDIDYKCKFGTSAVEDVTAAHIKCKWIKFNPTSYLKQESSKLVKQSKS